MVVSPKLLEWLLEWLLSLVALKKALPSVVPDDKALATTWTATDCGGSNVPSWHDQPIPAGAQLPTSLVADWIVNPPNEMSALAFSRASTPLVSTVRSKPMGVLVMPVYCDALKRIRPSLPSTMAKVMACELFALNRSFVALTWTLPLNVPVCWLMSCRLICSALPAGITPILHVSTVCSTPKKSYEQRLEGTEFDAIERLLGTVNTTVASWTVRVPGALTSTVNGNARLTVPCALLGVFVMEASAKAVAGAMHVAAEISGCISARLQAENVELPPTKGDIRELCVVVEHAPASPSWGAPKLCPSSCAMISAEVVMSVPRPSLNETP